MIAVAAAVGDAASQAEGLGVGHGPVVGSVHGPVLGSELGSTPAPASVAPILIFGWGNPSRGDDALGPALIEALERDLPPALASQVTLLTDFQLQIEHALDLVGRAQVLLVDAAIGQQQALQISVVQASKTAHQGSHALAPQALLQVYQDIHGEAAPPCTQLAIRAQRFELGEPLSAQAQLDLVAARDWMVAWVRAWVGPQG